MRHSILNAHEQQTHFFFYLYNKKRGTFLLFALCDVYSSTRQVPCCAALTQTAPSSSTTVSEKGPDLLSQLVGEDDEEGDGVDYTPPRGVETTEYSPYEVTANRAPPPATHPIPFSISFASRAVAVKSTTGVRPEPVKPRVSSGSAMWEMRISGSSHRKVLPNVRRGNNRIKIIPMIPSHTTR